ncbi:VanW family protein [Cohnella thailandensis]|uniref:VanW family protein n=1 Tax=Cohnella thailandensis TaxID=557557 RepID=A0A841SPM2_9BACL|nr:VanW family protein [Cohnella thailandensis]MBB6632546.1 VanW family protein [Cohnella thailandensis]MBP1971840.1 vancomycin resistance protein YoaR [Cohnella thailandensis]
MRKWWIAAIVFVIVVGVGAGTAGGRAIREGEDLLPARLSVGGLQIGGMSSEQALKLLRERTSELEKVKVRLKGDPSESSLPLAKLGMSIEAKEAERALEAFGKAKWYQRGKMKKELRSEYGFAVAWDETALSSETARAWGELGASEPRNASRTITELDEVVYAPEIIGTKADLAALRESIAHLAPLSLTDATPTEYEVELPLAEVVPEVTVASLKEEGLARKIMEFSTSFETSGEGRSHNVTAAAMALDGTLLLPGDEFSYGDIVAKAEKEYGYKEAPVIQNGKLVPGIGGGICQVSSTLYNAIIRVDGIDITERRNHSIPVSYLPLGLDATFADGYIDFRFKNTTGKQLLIRTVVKDKVLTVKLFGTMDESVQYEIETVQKKSVAPKTVYVSDSEVKLGGSKVQQAGKEGLVIESYRVKKVNGEAVERAKLATSTYKAQNELIAVNPADSRLTGNGGSDSGTGSSSGAVELV